MIYENIPDLVRSTIQSLYRGVFVTMDMSQPARVFDFVQTNDQVANIKVILSQVSLIVCSIFVLCIVYILMQRRMMNAPQEAQEMVGASDEVAPVASGVLRERWDKVVAHLEAPQEEQWKVAVIEADKLVDDALGKAGFSGDTFGDRLSNIQPGTLLSLDGIWWAHKIRNRLAHEVDYFLRYTEARQAIGYYEAALVELKLL